MTNPKIGFQAAKQSTLSEVVPTELLNFDVGEVSTADADVSLVDEPTHVVENEHPLQAKASELGLTLSAKDAAALDLSMKAWPSRYTDKANPDALDKRAVLVFLEPSLAIPNATKEPAYENGNNYRTPWGGSQSAYHHCKGVVCHSTPGHGGFKLGKKFNEQVPEPIRNENGWYEEDCEWAAVAVTFPELFKSEHVVMAHSSLKSWDPHGYEGAFGIKVAPEESRVLREEIFKQEHANDHVGVAAWGDWKEGIPKGMVGVFACKGGRMANGMYGPDERCFLVPQAEYDARSEFGMVIVPKRHQETLPIKG